MNITVKHEAPDFFGALQYTEDYKSNVNFSDLKKVFSYLKSNYNVGVVIDQYVIYVPLGFEVKYTHQASYA